MTSYTVYRIVLQPTRLFYVGVTRAFDKRMVVHRSYLRHGKHPAKKLQAGFNVIRRNFDKLDVEILLMGVGKDEAFAFEEKLIARHLSNPRMTNTMIGHRHADSSRAKTSRSGTGRPQTVQKSERISQALLGKRKSQSHRDALGAARCESVTNGKRTWPSGLAAAQAMGVTPACISYRIRKGIGGWAKCKEDI